MKHLIAAALLFSGSLFAQENHTSDTLFLTFKTHRNNEYQQILNMPGEFYDMGLVNGVLYEFKKKNKMIFAVPIDIPLAAPMMIYPEANHVKKYNDLWQTERGAKMIADAKKGL